jgi:hypothetical protein
MKAGGARWRAGYLEKVQERFGLELLMFSRYPSLLLLTQNAVMAVTGSGEHRKLENDRCCESMRYDPPERSDIPQKKCRTLHRNPLMPTKIGEQSRDRFARGANHFSDLLMG